MKLTVANPLDQIEFWLTNIPNESLQKELVSIATMWSEDVTFRNSTLPNFLNFLDSSTLSVFEIISRSLLVTRLIDFAFTGRKTDAEWQIVYDRHLHIKNHFEELGESDTISNEWLANYPETKANWINLYNSWVDFITDELPNEAIIQWFYDTHKK